MIPVLETERLLMREFRSSDLDEYAEMHGDRDVVKYLDGKTLNREDSWRHMAMVLGHWSLRGFGMWAVVERDSGELVGRVGCWMPEGWPDLEVGWTLRRKFWGHGYATEAAFQATNYAFSVLKRERIISIIRPENTASAAVAHRLGEKPAREMMLKDVKVVIWSLENPAED